MMLCSIQPCRVVCERGQSWEMVDTLEIRLGSPQSLAHIRVSTSHITILCRHWLNHAPHHWLQHSSAVIVTLNMPQNEKNGWAAKKVCLAWVMTSWLLWGDNNCNDRSVACQHESQPTTDTHWHNFNHYWGFLLLMPGPAAPGGNGGDGMWNDNSKPLKDFHFLLHILCVAAAVKMLNVMKYFLCQKSTDHGNRDQSLYPTTMFS